MTTILITMAGSGSRFATAGYTVPKYQVGVRGRTLFAWSLTSLSHFLPGAQVVFVALREAQAGPFIRAEAAALGIADPAVLDLDEKTDGQATSALLAAPLIRDPGAPLLIYNIDTYVEPAFLHPAMQRGDGWVPCFPGEGESWSFARVEGDDRIVELREKVRISPHATIGLYGFASFDLFRDTYHQHFQGGGNLERGERYIAPMYNHLIAQGRDVRLGLVPLGAVHPLGVPADVERFAAGSPILGGPAS